MVVLTKEQEKLIIAINEHRKNTNPTSLLGYSPFMVDAPKFSLSDKTLTKIIEEVDPSTLVYVISEHTRKRLEEVGIKSRILMDDVELTDDGIYRRKSDAPYADTIFLLDGSFMSKDVINSVIMATSHLIVFGDTYLSSFYVDTYFTKVDFTLSSPDKYKGRSLIMKYLLGRIRRNELKLEEKDTSNYTMVDAGLSKPEPEVDNLIDGEKIIEYMSDHDITVVNNGNTQLMLNKYYREMKLGYHDYMPRIGEKVITNMVGAIITEDGEIKEVPSGTIIEILDVIETADDVKHFVIKTSVEIRGEELTGEINVNKEFLKACSEGRTGYKVSTNGHTDGYLLSYCYAVGILQVFDREFSKVLVIFESHLHLNNVNCWLYTTANTVQDYLTILF